MNKNEQEIFEQYRKLEHALRIAKDALSEIKYLDHKDQQMDEHWSRQIAVKALAEIDEVLKNERE